MPPSQTPLLPLPPQSDAPLAPGDNREDLAEWLSESEGAARWEAVWSEWTPMSDAQQDAALSIEASVRHELIHALSLVTDAADRRIVIALWYIRARAAWGVLNLQTGYEANSGVWNLPAIYGLSALSASIERIEPLLPPSLQPLLQSVWKQTTVASSVDEPPVQSEIAALRAENAAHEARLREMQELLTERDRERWLLAAELGEDIAADDATETARRRLRQLAARLDEQTREVMRLCREDAVRLPERGTAPGAAEKIRELTQSLVQSQAKVATYEAEQSRLITDAVAGHDAEIAELRAQWKIVAEEAGVATPTMVALRIRSLQTQLQQIKSEVLTMLRDGSGLGEEMAALPPFGTRR